jgi:membrane protein implicated in regulation of membrane protease activity
MSRGPRRLQWGLPDSPPPKHPYRDSVIVYAAFAIVIVVIAWATGGAVAKAALIAFIFFAIASAWNVYRWRSRLREEAERTRRGGA